MRTIRGCRPPPSIGAPHAGPRSRRRTPDPCSPPRCRLERLCRLRSRSSRARRDQVSGGDALVLVEFPRQEGPAGRRLLLQRRQRDELAEEGRAATLVGVVSGFVVGENMLELKPSANTKRRCKRASPSTNYPHERPDLLRPAAAAVRVHDGAQRARAADHRQPGPLRHPGRAGGRERQLSERRARLSDRRRDDRRLEQELRGQPALRLPVPHHRAARSRRSPTARPVRCRPTSR